MSPGVAIGPAHRVQRGLPEIPEYCPTPDHLPEERRRFLEAVENSRQQMKRLAEQLRRQGGRAELLGILDAHRLMLEDRMVVEGVLARIDGHCNAEWAVSRHIAELREAFRAIDDPYLREKERDIEQVGRRLLHNLLGDPCDSFGQFPQPVILVSEDFGPADALLMNQETVLGFVTELGGRNSHTAIFARSLGIPAVAGAAGVMQRLRPGTTIALDGGHGWVYIDPDSAQSRQLEERRRQFQGFRRDLLGEAIQPAVTPDGTRVTLLANVDLPQDAERARRMGMEGIGLYRTEHLFMNRAEPPGEEEQLAAYRQVIRAMEGRPVVIRTLDLGGDKQVSTPGERCGRRCAESALGLVGIRLCLKRERTLFLTQLRAVLRAAAEGEGGEG
ncbi:MAG: phosphoenolpyruvate--protein phosphotransferase, partial [Magnetococcales bacterium]|nr:phosphoenolpyruvate--protein phosphotransferase [Magnetococcales bacterium]